MFRWMVAILMTGCLAGGNSVDPPFDMMVPDTSVADMDTTDEDASVDASVDVDMADPIEYGGLCDPFLQDCEHGKCVPNPQDGKATCVVELTNKGAGESCSSITQCERGTYCATLASADALCWPMCDIDVVDGGGFDSCAPGTACMARISSIPGLGLCVSED